MKKWVVDGRDRREVINGPLYGELVLFFVSWKTSRTNSEDFPGKAIGIAVVMETPSGYGGCEDDRAREREIISVIGFPNGSESVNGSQIDSQLIAIPVARSRAIDWFSVGSWAGISEKEVLKHC